MLVKVSYVWETRYNFQIRCNVMYCKFFLFKDEFLWFPFISVLIIVKFLIVSNFLCLYLKLFK